MKFTVNDKTYYVKWEYDRIQDCGIYKCEEYTACKIYDNTTSFDNPIVIGEATKAAGDRFCKNTGRKISLERALDKLFPFNKEARAIAWQEYFKESKKRLKTFG